MTKKRRVIRTKRTSLIRPKTTTSATNQIAASVPIIFGVDQSGFKNAPAERSDLTEAQTSRLLACKRVTLALQSVAGPLKLDSPNTSSIGCRVQRLVTLLKDQIDHHRVRQVLGQVSPQPRGDIQNENAGVVADIDLIELIRPDQRRVMRNVGQLAFIRVFVWTGQIVNRCSETW